MSEFKLDVKEEGDVVVITTEGYLNNVGGEKIAEACYEKIESGKNYFLLRSIRLLELNLQIIEAFPIFIFKNTFSY